MNNAQKFRAAIKPLAGAMELTASDWRGRSDNVWERAHGELIPVSGAKTTPGSTSNRIKRRDINAARIAGKRLAAINRRIAANRVVAPSFA